MLRIRNEGSRRSAFPYLASAVLALTACMDPLPTQSPGDVSSVHAASVAGAPVITQEPASVSLRSGDRFTLSVSATGTAPLAYQWYRNQSSVAGLTSPSFSKVAVGADSGVKWQCIVTNHYGGDTSRTVETFITGWKLEAENAVLSGAVKANDHVGYTGTGFIDFVHLSNDYVEWRVTLANPSNYRLEFRFANGSGSARNLKITVNGAVVNGSLAFPSTGSWSTWGGVSQFANLAAGTSVIRATATGTSGPNIDYLHVW